MRFTRKLAVSAAVFATFLSGCKKKHPVQPPAPPPVVQAQSTPTTQPATPTAGSAGTAPPAASHPERTTTPPIVKPKPRRVHRATNNKPAPKQSAPAQSVADVPRITIAEGSQPDVPGDLSASLPHTDEVHAKETSAQLIAGAELNLRGLKRQLSADEQNTLAQIRSFIAQSRQATKEGDDFRAHNLALKAHLLSDALSGAR